MSKIDEKELQELFIEIKHNNNIAFEKLYKRYEKLVYSIAFSILKNNIDAEDIVQIVFTKIYTIDKNKLPQDNEATWLYSVTKNESINYLKRKMDYIPLENLYEIKDSDKDINNIIDQIEFNNMISKLNEKEKEIISLKILSNMTFDDIGVLLDKSTGTIKWIYYKTINKLKILLSNLGMFVVTFTIGIRLLFKKEENIVNDISSNENTENKTENNQISIEQDLTFEDTNKNYSYKEEQNNIQQNTEQIIVQDNVQFNNINYIGLGFIGISIIFFTIFITFFIKHQLKSRKKLSK